MKASPKEIADSAAYKRRFFEGEFHLAKRIISALVGIVLFIGVIAGSLYFRYTFSVFVSLLNCVAVWEIFSATKMTKYRPMLICSMILGAVVPFLEVMQSYIFAVCFAYIVFNFAYMLFHQSELKMEQVMLSGGLSIIIPSSFSALCRMFDMGIDGRFGMNERDGIFLVVLSCAVAWLADTGAYFTGVFIGKHKLCPNISPKKTVEGLAGGVVTNVVFSMLIGYGYQLIFAGGGRVNLWLIAVIAFFAAFAGALGDLTASVLKRECGIKDYGKIMPGHGGVLDRFDSVFMTAPLTYLFVETFGAYFPIIIR